MSRDGIAVILVYHRVAEEELDPFGLCVRPGRFLGHLAALKKIARIKPLSKLVAEFVEGRLSDQAVAITFDDGYADNLHVALPLLERHETPATFFIVADPMNLGGAFWWDELTTLVFGSSQRAAIRVVVSGQDHEWPFDNGGRGGAADSWRAWETPPTPRTRAFRDLWGLVRSLDPAARKRILDQLRTQLDEGPACCPRTLTGDELVELSRSQLAEIGAHTMSHRRLADVSRADQEQEVVGSKHRLEEHLQREVRGFAYPFGGPEDYGSDTVAIVRCAGFEYACVVAEAPVGNGCSPFELPRLQVDDCEPEELVRKVSKLFQR
jgi:peptidoglycan/xylan/chitin deacetylase (PgdA/CDA1 family)